MDVYKGQPLGLQRWVEWLYGKQDTKSSHLDFQEYFLVPYMFFFLYSILFLNDRCNIFFYFSENFLLLSAQALFCSSSFFLYFGFYFALKTLSCACSYLTQALKVDQKHACGSACHLGFLLQADAFCQEPSTSISLDLFVDTGWIPQEIFFLYLLDEYMHNSGIAVRQVRKRWLEVSRSSQSSFLPPAIRPLVIFALESGSPEIPVFYPIRRINLIFLQESRSDNF